MGGAHTLHVFLGLDTCLLRLGSRVDLIVVDGICCDQATRVKDLEIFKSKPAVNAYDLTTSADNLE